MIGGKEIRAGDRVVLFAYGAHHNAEVLGRARRVPARALHGRAAKKR